MVKANYKCVTDITEVKEYLGSNKIVAYDYETSPDDAFRNMQVKFLLP